MLTPFFEILNHHPIFCAVFVTLLGASIGSFLNVVIYRVPAEKSIVTPGSHCACGTSIAWYDNVPILSWLLLRGRARCCGSPFSFRYPFVELLTAGLFLACWLHFPPVVAVVGWVFLSCLVCASFIDLDHMIIPDAFTLGLGVVGVILSILVPALHFQSDDFYLLAGFRAAIISLQGLLVGSGLVMWIALLAEIIFKKEAIGLSNVKFVGAIGAFTGWEGAVIAFFSGAVIGTLWIRLGWFIPQKVRDGSNVPFGPMLAIAGAIYFLWPRSLFLISGAIP